jgi:hypothetical protein
MTVHDKEPLMKKTDETKVVKVRKQTSTKATKIKSSIKAGAMRGTGGGGGEH